MFGKKSDYITNCDNVIPTLITAEKLKCTAGSEDKICKVSEQEKEFAKELLIKLSKNTTCASQMGITKKNLCEAKYISSGAHGFTFKIGNHIMKLLIQDFYELTREELFVT